MASFDAMVLKNADHFLMMNRPDEFNAALEKAIRRMAAIRTSRVSQSGPSFPLAPGR